MTHLPGERPSASPHLRLTPDEVKRLWNDGHYKPKGYLYHLILAHRQAGWWFKIENVSEFCRTWEIPRRTFYRAKAALIAENQLEEEIIGSVNVRVPNSSSTSVCATGDTGVSEVAPGVTDLAQLVPNLSHLSSEILSQQEVYDPTDLYRSFTTTYTQGVSVENSVLDLEIVQTVVDNRSNGSTSIPQSPQNSNTDIESEAIVSIEDQYSAPPILQRAKKYGVNIDDPKLRAAIEKHPERVEQAIACLDEKQLTVKSPTRFLCAAIEQDWRPEKNVTPSEWGTWFNEAQKRGLVKASQQVNDVIQVLTRNGQWIPYETLRRMDWDELQAQLNPAPEFVEETIKTVTMHPDHGQVLEVNATAVTPDPQELSAKIKALGEVTSEKRDRDRWVADAKTRYAQEWGNAGVLDGELVPQSVGGALALIQSSNADASLALAAEMEEALGFNAQLDLVEAEFSEADFKAFQLRGARRGILQFKVEAQAAADTYNQLRQKSMGVDS